MQNSTMRSNSMSATTSGEAENGEDGDGDDYLLQQALASARAIHHIHGIQFDELQDINVLTDIKFVVATVELPLGRKFVSFDLLFVFIERNNSLTHMHCVCLLFFLLNSIVSRTRNRCLGIKNSTRWKWST